MPAPDFAWAYPLILRTHVSLVAGSAGLFALLCLAFMASVALARHPLGWWAP